MKLILILNIQFQRDFVICFRFIRRSDSNVSLQQINNRYPMKQTRRRIPHVRHQNADYSTSLICLRLPLLQLLSSPAPPSLVSDLTLVTCSHQIMDTVVVKIVSALQLHNLSLQEEDLDALNHAINTLKSLKYDVNERISAAEAHFLAPRYEVLHWLKRVQAVESEVSVILSEGSQLLDRSCSFCPFNCWTTHMFHKKIIKNLALVKDLSSQQHLFGTVAEQVAVYALPEPNLTVGLVSKFETAWNYLQQGDVPVLGLYGMGGGGKTTLLKKIYNRCQETGSHFDLVIWVVISMHADVERIRRDIGDRLGLVRREGQESTTRDISNVLEGKRFLLLLDDIWERLDLSSIGIPIPNGENESKMVFTTRSEAVCGWMDADKKIRVELLNWREAWELFTNRVGHKIFHLQPEILELAETIVEECAGLPLALISIGTHMKGKKTLQEWKDAIGMLQLEYPGIQDGEFSILKFSYDNLSQYDKSFLLFCSLYPGGFLIPVEPLIKQWIVAEEIYGFDEWEEAVNKSYDIIETLESYCLLENVKECSYVVMHDIVRQISSDFGKDTGKLLVQTGSDITVAPIIREWEMAERVSLAHTRIVELVGMPNCPKLSTLLLSGSSRLSHISDHFFQFMPTLRFLDLSNTSITKLPTSVGNLVCLEYLDLSFTLIEELPYQVKELKSLKFFSMDSTIRLPKISGGVIKHLSNLEMLRLSEKCFGVVEEEKLAGINDLVCLEKLMALEIEISSVIFLNAFFLNHDLVRATNSLSIVGESDGSVTRLALPPTPLLSSSIQSLRKLKICDCEEMEELLMHDWPTGEKNGLQNLETMTLRNLPKLVVSWDITNGNGLRFTRLHHITIIKCNSMRNLTWLYLVPKLRILVVESCSIMEEIVSDDDAAFNGNIFLTLRVLILKDLPLLRFIYATPLALPSLETIRVSHCPNLRRLPLKSHGAGENSLKSIKGEAQWWDSLEWEDEALKLATPFYPV